MDVMARRRAIMAQLTPSSGRLPEEYQEVYYIDSDAAGSYKPYINTGLVPNENMRLVVKGKILMNTEGSRFLFGSRASSSSKRFWGNSWQGYFKYGLGNNGNTSVVRAQELQDFEYDFNYNNDHLVSVNGNISGVNTINDTYTLPLFLFGCNTNGSIDGQYLSTRIYQFTAYESYNDTTPVMNLIPCYRKRDNAVGMFDLVSKTFFMNAGTGWFLRGLKIHETSDFDYCFFANQDGEIPAVTMDTVYGVTIPQGGSATVAWDKTGYDGSDRVLCSGVDSDGHYWSITEDELTDTIGEMTINKPGRLMISRSTANITGPMFIGKYIKIKINQGE